MDDLLDSEDMQLLLKGFEKVSCSDDPNDYILANFKNMLLYAGNEDKAWYYEKVYGSMNGAYGPDY